MKVVINACYGGFSLSPEAVKFIADKKGLPCYFYVEQDEDEEGNRVDYDNRIYKKVSMKKAKKAFTWKASTIDNEKEYNELHSFDWRNASQEERISHNAAYDKLHHTNRPDNRHDESLVEAVETLGSKKASGSCAQLKVVEIPIKVYNIDEYDGLESISEPHQTWS